MKTLLINRKQVRGFALEISRHRAHRFDRVGAAFLVKAEASLKEFIRTYVRTLPSKGKTIL